MSGRAHRSVLLAFAAACNGGTPAPAEPSPSPESIALAHQLGAKPEVATTPSTAVARERAGKPEVARTSALPANERLLQVAAGNYSACARGESGKLLCWGRCGVACDGARREGGGAIATVAGIDDAVDVAVGDSFACAARRSGAVACWGSNFYGAVGIAEDRDVATPTDVVGIAGVIEVEATQTMSCALTRGGEVFVWGGVADASPPPEPATRSPRRVEGLGVAKRLVADPFSCCSQDDGGRWQCFDAGMVASAPSDARVHRSCGCSLDAAKTLRCEMHERPGPPTADGNSPPTPLTPCSIDAVDEVEAFALADGAGYAVRRDGGVWAWGELPGTYVRAALHRVAGLEGVRSIAAGALGAIFAVDGEGRLWGWGWSAEQGIGPRDELVAAPRQLWPAAP